jgi:hypothetical protein
LGWTKRAGSVYHARLRWLSAIRKWAVPAALLPRAKAAANRRKNLAATRESNANIVVTVETAARVLRAEIAAVADPVAEVVTEAAIVSAAIVAAAVAETAEVIAARTVDQIVEVTAVEIADQIAPRVIAAKAAEANALIVEIAAPTNAAVKEPIADLTVANAAKAALTEARIVEIGVTEARIADLTAEIIAPPKDQTETRIVVNVPASVAANAPAVTARAVTVVANGPAVVIAEATARTVIVVPTAAIVVENVAARSRARDKPGISQSRIIRASRKARLFL